MRPGLELSHCGGELELDQEVLLKHQDDFSHWGV